ncbi:MAG: hypothetical protein AB7H80_13290 [Candidatus Kapaibacterium sp.]
MNRIYRRTLLLSLLALAAFSLISCDGNSGPISEPIPQGLFVRIAPLDNGRELQSTLQLERDSAFITDTIYSFPAGVRTIDSIHSVQLELNPAGDGYYRTVEEHLASGSDIVSNVLRYWYFFQRNDSLFYYRGIRLRGNNTGIVGGWRLSTADSAYIGTSYNYVFTEDSVAITESSKIGVLSTSYAYSLDGSQLSIHGLPSPPFGSRFEIIPGLALYLTTKADIGYEKQQ